MSAPPSDPVSIVVVTYNSASTIGRCLEALEASTPEPHELVVVDNASTDGTLDGLTGRRVRVIANGRNLGFSRAVNQGIHATAGLDPRRGHIVLLNPDAEVTPGWLPKLLTPLVGDVAAVGPLSNYVAALQKFELHWDRAAGKPPADPRALAAVLAARNRGRTIETKLLIGFCLALRRDLVCEHGGLDEDLFLGNDDLEYSLRMRRLGYRLLVAADCYVAHAGQRSFESLPPAERTRLTQESTDALQRKLERWYGENGVPSPMDLWGIEWFRPTPGRELVSIVVPVWNNLALTRTCLGSLRRYTREPYEVVVVDNGSTDGTPEYLATVPGIRVVRNDRNLGFAAACNQGLAAASGRHAVLLNNDVVLTPEWLEGLLAHVHADPRIGIVGPRTNFAGGPQQLPTVGYRSLDGLEAFARERRRQHLGERTILDRVTGLCMLISGPCLRKVGALDERFGIGNFEDDDYCVRARLAGFQCAIAHDVFVHHFGSQTFRALGIDYRALLEKNRRIFLEKWSHLTAAGSGGAATAAKAAPPA